jgi:hypothetical protein
MNFDGLAKSLSGIDAYNPSAACFSPAAAAVKSHSIAAVACITP